MKKVGLCVLATYAMPWFFSSGCWSRLRYADGKNVGPQSPSRIGDSLHHRAVTTALICIGHWNISALGYFRTLDIPAWRHNDTLDSTGKMFMYCKCQCCNVQNFPMEKYSSAVPYHPNSQCQNVNIAKVSSLMFLNVQGAKRSLAENYKYVAKMLSIEISHHMW